MLPCLAHQAAEATAQLVRRRPRPLAPFTRSFPPEEARQLGPRWSRRDTIACTSCSDHASHAGHTPGTHINNLMVKSVTVCRFSSPPQSTHGAPRLERGLQSLWSRVRAQ
jgi:hypothetical protein